MMLALYGKIGPYQYAGYQCAGYYDCLHHIKLISLYLHTNMFYGFFGKYALPVQA